MTVYELRHCNRCAGPLGERLADPVAQGLRVADRGLREGMLLALMEGAEPARKQKRRRKRRGRKRKGFNAATPA